jgi:hypothetical protein
MALRERAPEASYPDALRAAVNCVPQFSYVRFPRAIVKDSSAGLGPSPSVRN